MPDTGPPAGADPVAPATSGVVRFGSFVLDIDADDPFWTSIFPRRFRTRLQPREQLVPDAVVTVRTATPLATRPPRTLTLHRDGTRVRLESDVMSLSGDWASRPVIATLSVHERSADPAWLEHCFSVLIHKLLQLSGVIRLHAAAVEIGGRTSLFVGDKGAGKSSLALALGRAGGRVLADDQVVLRNRAGRYSVSGADGLIRLTSQSERHFFTTPLDVPAADFAGVLKKEVPLSSIVAAAPFEDRPVTRLYFPAVGQRPGVRPISRQAAALRLLDAIAITHGFADQQDRVAFLQLVSGFAATIACAELELSPDLSDLARLAAIVSG